MATSPKKVKDQVCASCGKEAPLKCSRCANEFYCTAECQRSHWSTHKAACVKIQKSPTNGPMKATDAFNQLRALKEKQQKAMQQNNTKVAIEIGKQALTVALQLNGPVVDNELAQLYHNLSHLCLSNEPQDLEKAEEYGSHALKHSELDLKKAPDNPNSLDLHSVILIAQAQRRLMDNKVEAAEKPTLRALEIAEEIFGNDDPRLVKALRACAMLRERQNNLSGSCEYLRRAYENVLKKMGMMHPGVQQLLDEYVMILLKSEKIDDALTLARDAYDQVVDKTGSDSDIATDCASRLTNVLVKKNKLDEAEKLMKSVVDVRTNKFGPSSLHVAAAVASLGSIREQKGLYDAETEGYLRDAYRVFRNDPQLGPNSPNARQCGAQVNRVRKKRIELGQKVEDETLEEENMFSKALQNARSDGEKVHMLMKQSTVCFEEGKFKQAEPLLEEALKLSEKEFGGNHQATKAAAQNLQITRNNVILQLWQEVVDEEKAKIDERKKNGESSWDMQGEFTILGNL